MEVPGRHGSITTDMVQVKGPKGTLSSRGRTATWRSSRPRTAARTSSWPARRAIWPERATHGLIRTLLGNMVNGVTDGWNRQLEINGVGFKAESKG